jgi:hypothetical protein
VELELSSEEVLSSSLLEVGLLSKELLTDDPEPLPTMYGQGLQLGYEKPHVCPRRHVHARPRTGSRGQLWICVHVLGPVLGGVDGWKVC